MTTTMGSRLSIVRPPVRVRKPKVAPPTLDAPTGLYDPRVILAKSKRTQSYCGPWMAMALTGLSFEEVRAGLNLGRNRHVTEAVKGTYRWEMERFLTSAGVRIIYRSDFHAAARSEGETLTLARFLRMRRGDDLTRTFGIIAGHHWIVVRGRKVTCAMLQRWTWIKHAKKRRAPVELIWQIADRDKTKTRTTRERLRKEVRTAVKAQKIIQKGRGNSGYWKKVAEAEMKRLNCCEPDVTRERDFFEVRIYAPDDWWWRETNEQGWTFDGWKDIAEALRGKTAEELLEPDTTV